MTFSEINAIRTKEDAWRNWEKTMNILMAMMFDPVSEKVWLQIGQQVYFQTGREIHHKVFNRLEMKTKGPRKRKSLKR